MTPSELVAIADAILEEERELARERQREGRREGGKTAGKGRAKDSSPKSFREPMESETRHRVAAKVGVSAPTLAETALGRFLRESPKNEGGRPTKTGTSKGPVSVETPVLADLGLTKKESAEIKVRCERRIGEMLREIPKRRGSRPPDAGLHDVTPSIQSLGIERIQSHRWQAIFGIPAAQWVNVRTGKPYSKRHVCIVAESVGYLDTQGPRPRFRDIYNQVTHAKAGSEPKP